MDLLPNWIDMHQKLLGNDTVLSLAIQPMMGDRCTEWSGLFREGTMIVALLYLILAGAYLLVIPVAVLFYLKQRWYVATSVERTLMYFLVFFFFPGLLVLSPFVNLRPQPRQIV